MCACTYMLAYVCESMHVVHTRALKRISIIICVCLRIVVPLFLSWFVILIYQGANPISSADMNMNGELKNASEVYYIEKCHCTLYLNYNHNMQ